MKRSLLISFCLLVFTQVLAQKYEIKLAAEKFESPIHNVSVGEVIDLRSDKTNIGWIWKGIGNMKVHGDVPGKLPDELKAFVNSNLAIGNQTHPLIVKINKFNVSEKRIGEFEYATAEIALEFLIERKDGSYCSILNTGSSNELTARNDVTYKHARNLAVALEDCFKQVSLLNIPEVCSKRPSVSADYLQVNTYYNPDPQSFPILSADKPKKGFYRNFKEFKFDQPGLDEEITRKSNGAFVYTETGKKANDIWGYSDGERAYIRYGDQNNFFPLTKQNDRFTFYGTVTTVDNGAIIIGSVLGGIAGAALAGALTENTETVNFSVNPLTGRIASEKGFGPAADLARTAKILLYRNSKNESAAPVSFFVNDSLYAQIPPNSVQEFSFKVPVSAMDFCLKGSDQSCLKVTPILDKTTYFVCSQPGKANAKPVLKITNEQEANYYLKIIKHNQEKAVK